MCAGEPRCRATTLGARSPSEAACVFVSKASVRFFNFRRARARVYIPTSFKKHAHASLSNDRFLGEDEAVVFLSRAPAERVEFVELGARRVGLEPAWRRASRATPILELMNHALSRAPRVLVPNYSHTAGSLSLSCNSPEKRNGYIPLFPCYDRADSHEDSAYPSTLPERNICLGKHLG